MNLSASGSQDTAEDRVNAVGLITIHFVRLILLCRLAAWGRHWINVNLSERNGVNWTVWSHFFLSPSIGFCFWRRRRRRRRRWRRKKSWKRKGEKKGSNSFFRWINFGSDSASFVSFFLFFLFLFFCFLFYSFRFFLCFSFCDCLSQ